MGDIYLELTTKLCQNCGKPISNYRGHGQKYCDTCRDVVNAENKKRWARENRLCNANFCMNCGKFIYGYSGHGQQYCKACSVNIRLENVKRLRLAYYRKWKDVLIQCGYGVPLSMCRFWFVVNFFG